jgi:branched-chain amino acid transport system permease protein
MSTLQTLVDAVALGSLFALVAMGIALVFGVMRLVNFAHGELLTAGAYALFLTSDLPLAVSIVVLFGTVIAFALAMETSVRPLRSASPAAMLVTTFAISFLLQSIFLVVWGSQGDNVGILPELNRAADIGGLRVRWVTLTSIGVGALLLGGTALLLNRTTIGLEMRAAAYDFRTARILGVRANRVIRFAFVVAGVLAAVATLMLVVQRPLVTPTFGFQFVIPALVGVVVGGLDRLTSATLGGFAIGFATALLGDVLPSDARVFLPSVVFALVIVVLLVRPSGLFTRARAVAERV